MLKVYQILFSFFKKIERKKKRKNIQGLFSNPELNNILHQDKMYGLKLDFYP